MTNEYSILQPILSEQEALNILTRMAGGETLTPILRFV